MNNSSPVPYAERELLFLETRQPLMELAPRMGPAFLAFRGARLRPVRVPRGHPWGVMASS